MFSIQKTTWTLIVIFAIFSSSVYCYQECCFEIGYGARAVPSNLGFIQCSEYETRTAPDAIPVLGGAVGKVLGLCPNDAMAADEIIKNTVEQACGCCFEIGYGAFNVPGNLNFIQCSEYERQTAPGSIPRAGGAIGKVSGLCPSDAQAAHEIITYTEEKAECCFGIGYGALSVPGNLNFIDCSEYERETAPGSEPRVGGALGKVSGLCPNDAQAAHDLIQAQTAECCFSIGYGALAVPGNLDIIECSEYEQLTAPGSEPRAGGALGKVSGPCPNDAQAAHDLIEAQTASQG